MLAVRYAELYPSDRRLNRSPGVMPTETEYPSRLRYDFEAAFRYAEAVRQEAVNRGGAPAGSPEDYLAEVRDYRLSAAFLLDGDRVRSDAVLLHGLRHGKLGSPAGLNAAPKAILDYLRANSRQHVSAVATEYQQRYQEAMEGHLSAVLSSTDQDEFDAMFNGTRFDGIAARLHRAMDGLGTEEDEVWKELAGLYADERAMVAQAYRLRYERTLLADINDEFSNNMFDGPELDKTVKLYRHGGLSTAERIFYATEGWGTDEEEIRRAMAELRRMTPTEIQAVNEAYGRLVPGGTLQGAFDGDLSLGLWRDATEALNGQISTVEQFYQLARRRYEYERGDTAGNWIGNFVSGINTQGQNLDAAWQRIQAAYQAIPEANRNDPLENHPEFRRVIRQMDQDVDAYRGFRSAAAELGANALATVAGMVAFAATGGTITPMIVALAAGASTQSLTRMGIEGTFTWEELPADLVNGGANGLLAALTLPSAARVAGTRFGILRVAAESPFASGMFAGGLTRALQEDTWRDGSFAVGFVNIAQAATLGGFAGSALSRVPGAAVTMANASGLTALTRTVATTTGRTVVSIVDSSLHSAVRGIRATGATLRNALESVFTTQRLDDIALFLVNRTATESLDSIRTGLRNLLASLDGPRLGFVTESAMDVVEASRSEFGTLGESGIRVRVLDRLEVVFNSLADAVESVRTRLRIAGSPITDDVGERLAARLSVLPESASEAEIRTALSDVLGAGTTITDDMVRITREFLAPERIPPGSPGSAEHKALRWQDYQQRGGQWTYERWSRTYDQNMLRARLANEVADSVHAELGWGTREVTVNAGGVDRRLDIADVSLRRAVEVKSGYTCLSEEILWEVLSDAYLVSVGWEITWRFEGTASQPLLRALDNAGIGYTGVLVR